MTPTVSLRRDIATPALVCDLDILRSNVERMASLTAAAGVGLRPHVKSHKSFYVAQLQLAAGAVGLCVAKLAEAESLMERFAVTEGALPSILLTSPTFGASSADRAARLARRGELLVAVDHPEGVAEIAASASRQGVNIGVLCDVDVGLGRTGVRGPNEALVIADAVIASSHLTFRGVQGYGGHLQHIEGRDERRRATTKSAECLRVVVAALEDRGVKCDVRSGGGTGTSLLDIDDGVLNEIQAGSYVFMDREYRDALGDDPEGAFQQSLRIATTVISVNQDRFVTVDAGLKAMATDSGAPVVLGINGATYNFFGDEHGLVTHADDHRFVRGERLELVPPHCDPTVDRYDVMWLVRGDHVVDVVPVDARGRSQ